MAAAETSAYVEEEYLRHDLQERLTHWTAVIAMIVLVLTGFQIRNPSFAPFGTMGNAQYLHMVFGYLFLCVGVIHVYFFFAAGKWKIAMPVFSDIPEFVPIIKYYLFITKDKPDYAKYNPLQKSAYAALFVVSLFMCLTGFALYWPGYFEGFVYSMGGLMAIRGWHLLITWIYIGFTGFHVYIAITEDWRLLRALVTGYYCRRVIR